VLKTEMGMVIGIWEWEGIRIKNFFVHTSQLQYTLYTITGITRVKQALVVRRDTSSVAIMGNGT